MVELILKKDTVIDSSRCDNLRRLYRKLDSNANLGSLSELSMTTGGHHEHFWVTLYERLDTVWNKFSICGLLGLSLRVRWFLTWQSRGSEGPLLNLTSSYELNK